MAIDLPSQYIPFYEKQESGLFAPKSLYVIKGYEQSILPGIMPGAGLMAGGVVHPFEVVFVGVTAANTTNGQNGAYNVTFNNVSISEADSTRKLIVNIYGVGGGVGSGITGITVDGVSASISATANGPVSCMAIAEYAKASGTTANIYATCTNDHTAYILTMYVVYNGSQSVSATGDIATGTVLSLSTPATGTAVASAIWWRAAGTSGASVLIGPTTDYNANSSVTSQVRIMAGSGELPFTGNFVNATANALAYGTMIRSVWAAD